MTASDDKAVEEGCYFDEDQAERVKRFFARFLRHSKGEWAGQPFALLDWQYEQIVKPLFGWRQANGLRRFNLAYIEIPKKNGKSTLLSGLALYFLIADDEPGAEVYCCAADKDQAGIIFNESRNMVSASTSISKHVKPVDSKKRLVFDKTKSFFAALSSEVSTKEGFNASAILFDELHAQPNRKLWETLRYAGAARRQPIIISITTAGYDRESICWEQHEYARKVLSGEIVDPSFFGLIYSAADDDDWTDPQVWAKVNPSLGITVNQDLLKAASVEARNEPRKENAFRRYRLNQWVSSNNQWLSSKAWKDCRADFKEKDLDGRPCFIGLDLARKHDLAAVVYVFPRRDLFYVIPRFFIPSDNAHKKEALDRVPYITWERQGFITFTEGDTIDYRVIRQTILDDVQRHEWRPKEIGFDPYNAELLCRGQLGDEDGFEVIVVAQTPKVIGPATAFLEKLVKENKIRHNGNEVLNWCAQNAVVKTDHDSGDIMVVKGRATGRVDGVSALVNGLSRAMVADSDDEDSIYNHRGILAI